MIKLLLIILVIILLFNIKFDYTKERDLLMWYGRNKRRYIKIF